jgi:site-specific DNA recombinase
LALDTVQVANGLSAHPCKHPSTRSVAELATAEGISDRYVSALLPLAMLAPDILEAITAGRQPPELTAHRLIRTVNLPIAWAAQKQLLGIP